MGIKYKNGDAYSAVCPYGVDDVYITFSSISPATRWPGTTWTLVTAGTFLVAGMSSGTYKVGNTGGEATHALTENEIAVHRHIGLFGMSDGVESMAFPGYGNYKDGGFWAILNTGASIGDAQRTADAGGGAAHNNMPPYIACYMWRRTGGGYRHVAMSRAVSRCA